MRRHLYVFLAVLALSACDHYSQKLSFLDSWMGLNAIEPAAGGEVTFSTYLAQEYYALAMFENDEMMDYPAAKMFTEKAMAAEEERVVAPARPEDFEIVPVHIAELEKAREDLIDALKHKRIPENYAALARAQAKYDCWVEQQEEAHQPGDIVACQFEFIEAMAALKDPLPDDQHLAAYFDHNSAEVNLMAWAEIQQAVDFIKEYPQYKIILTGHTDTSGSAEYNKAMAERRVQAVAAEFYRSLSGITVYQQAAGEQDPAIATGDNVKEAKNRRVDIVLKRPNEELM